MDHSSFGPSHPLANAFFTPRSVPEHMGDSSPNIPGAQASCLLILPPREGPLEGALLVFIVRDAREEDPPQGVSAGRSEAEAQLVKQDFVGCGKRVAR